MPTLKEPPGVAPPVFDETLVENVQWMLDSGEWPGRIAGRLGMTPAGLSRIMYRHGRPDLARIFSCEQRREHRERSVNG